jgi:hypothetical protein
LRKDQLLATAALLCHVIGFSIYNWQLLAGQSSPNAASWGMWAFVTVLNFTSYKALSKDWVKSLLPTLSSLLCILTFVLAVFRGRLAALGTYDAIALALALIACGVWWMTKSAMKAQLLLQLCIAIAFIPTYISVWEVPRHERALGWLIWTMAFVTQTRVVRLRWRGQKMDLLYPINNAVLHFAVAVLALR